jgi:transcriptional regulator with XRE-family HTH domain
MLFRVNPLKRNIRRLMKARGIGPSALARRCGVPPQRTNDWLNRSKTLELPTLLRIAAALEADVNELVTGLDLNYDKVAARPTLTTEWSNNEPVHKDRSDAMSKVGVLEERIDLARDRLEAVRESISTLLDDLGDHKGPPRAQQAKAGTRRVRVATHA